MDKTSRAALGVSLVADILDKGVEINVSPFGMSMAPFIMHGEGVVLRQTVAQSIGVGSVVAFRDKAESWIILHRVIKVNQRARQLLTMGDCQLYAELIQMDDVLGEVIRVEKDGLILDMKDPWVRACNYFVAKNSQVFYLLHGWLQRLRLQRSGLGPILLRNRLALPSLALAILRRFAEH